MVQLRMAMGVVLVMAGLSAAQSGPGALPQQATPSGVPLARAQEVVHGLYKKEYAKAGAGDRVALAKLLLAQAAETRDDPAARYVCLSDAMELAAGAGNTGVAFAAIGELGRLYIGTEVMELQRRAIVRALANGTAADAEGVMTLALEVAERAAVLDAFEVVTQMAGAAEAAGIKTQKVRVAASSRERVEQLRALAAEFGQVKAAYAKLDAVKDGADPEVMAAHLTIGTFYALHKGQWALGLPHLARGPEGELRELARRDLEHVGGDMGQLGLGDGWWEYGQAATGVTRVHVLAHARECYAAAKARLEGITLARIQARLAAAETQPAAGVPAAAGAAVNLLTLIDTAKDGAAGTWVRRGAELAAESSAYATCQIPYAMPEEFDLRVTFTRVAGTGPVAVLVAAQRRSFEYVLDIKGEGRFERVGGKIAQDNPTVTPVAVSNGRKYVLTVQCRKGVVRALLDEKVLTEWKTDYKDLTRYSVWKLGDTGLCGVGANNAQVVFHGIEVVEVTGKGKGTR